MKILQINTRYRGGGGAAEIAGSLHRNLNDNTDHISTFLYGRGESDDKNAIYIGNKIDVHSSALLARITGKQKNFHFDSSIEKFVYDSDIVHLHNLHGYYIDYDKLIAIINKYNKKVVWTLHDIWPITGRCGFSFGCEKWKTGCGECKNKEIYPKTFLDRSASDWINKKSVFNSLDKKNTLLVTPSKWLKEIIKESYLKEYNVEVINNGITEPKEIKESKDELRNIYEIPKSKKVILFVAADPNDSRKGMKYILDLIPKMKEYTFVSVGKKMENIDCENFFQLGYVSNKDEINRIYSLADVFVIPSVDDNFPTTVLEAFSNSIPVVGFDSGGVKEQVDNNCGILVENKDGKALMNSLKELLGNEYKLERYSINCRKKYDKLYTDSVFTKHYINVYKNLLLDKGDEIENCYCN